jgi:outer membrane protein assembly factor BamD
MNRWSVFCLIAFALLAFPYSSPAPLIYRPGEGWIYERPGAEGKWQRARAQDQLAVAEESFTKKDYGTALKAARRTVSQWPLSDYAPRAQYLIGRSYEAKRQDDKAFKQYQKLIEKYPKIDNYQEVVERQFQIANRYLAGQWFKLWGYVPFFPSMDRTAQMYEKIIKNGPYGEVGPQSQLNIGQAREKQKDYPQAVKAYKTAADRYHDQTQVASEGLYKAGLAQNKEAKSSEYDQNVATEAIATFSDFAILYPNDGRVPDAQQRITALRTEQARGSFEVARFYERKHQWKGALIYYNEVLVKDPNSKYAALAREKIDAIKKRTKE